MSSLLILSTEFPPESGGIGKYTFEIARQLTTFGYRVVVVTNCMDGSEAFDRQAPFPVYRVGHDRWRYLKGLALAWKAVTVLKKHHCGYILATSWPYAGTLALLLGKGLALPYGVIGYGLEITKYSARGVIGRWGRAVFTHSQKAFVISAFTRDVLQRRGIDPDHVVLLYAGVDAQFFQPGVADAGLRERYGLVGKKIILTVGRLVERKGHDTVLQALPQVARHVPEVAYLIVGNGPHRAALQALAHQLGVDRIVHFVGEVEEGDLPSFYRLCDVFAMPNRAVPATGDVEGFGLVFLEANACAKPVIGGRSGGAVEAIVDGVTGVLVQPLEVGEIAGALVRILTDAAYGTRLGQYGRQRVLQELTWTAVARRLASWLPVAAEPGENT